MKKKKKEEEGWQRYTVYTQIYWSCVSFLSG